MLKIKIDTVISAANSRYDVVFGTYYFISSIKYHEPSNKYT
jgi:hypothetical protein